MATGADKYFERRSTEPGYAEAYDAARRKIDQIDRLVRALDSRRETLGMTKAELARRADLTPEVVRRLFSADSPNPTIGTLTALADSHGARRLTRPRTRAAGTARRLTAHSRTVRRHSHSARIVRAPR